MHWTDFKQSNMTWKGDGESVGDLPAYRDRDLSISCWEMSAAEKKEFDETGRVWLHVYGRHPPVSMTAISPFEEQEDQDMQWREVHDSTVQIQAFGTWKHRGERVATEHKVPSPDGTDRPFTSVADFVNASEDPDDDRKTIGMHTVAGTGFSIAFQDTLHGKEGEFRRGATTEEVLGACFIRLLLFQNHSSFPSDENQQAMNHIQAAIQSLHNRTHNRLKRGVEGKNEK